eukprot:CAMPEP_0178960370 /NCGR_PEP_ID=MMETSP0789-20121207/12924_1 /TAXON_ID=3005 /ORGANISM="Rhizosolenia setigera, Strain CCMP 1694" /LENGTH=159 /DNA_ID=CAMNT_0020643707 /DNA_START=87 /DNA_END=562 /DNA_ORIENTATION=-
MNINTDETPEGISWKIENMNTSEIVASQDEGFYTEAQTLYVHDESICLDLDNTDICYNITVSDTSEDDDYPSTRTLLFYDNEDPEDRYYKSTDVNETNIVCGFDDFESFHGCLYSEPEPSCECDKTFACFLEEALAFIFAIVFCPCLSIQFVFFMVLYA